MSARIDWSAVIPLAASAVRAETASLGLPPTLRRVHYLLVSDPAATAAGYRNTQNAYKRLSDLTAAARRDGLFPPLTDLTRRVHQPLAFDTEEEARDWLADLFRLDRRPLFGRRVAVVVEKAGLVPLLRSRFDWIDVAALSGYASQTLIDELDHDVIVYAGDYDPSGLDIERDLSQRTGRDVRRVALTAAQVAAYGLPPALAKSTDSRLASMVASEGSAMQVELDALDPNVLLGLVADAVQDATGLEIGEDCQPVVDHSFLDDERAIRARLRGGAS